MTRWVREYGVDSSQSNWRRRDWDILTNLMFRDIGSLEFEIRHQRCLQNLEVILDSKLK
jgi:hypothetical protein